ncbi:MAG: NAD(P)/FAD-dependent oxidoreductase [Gemmatimonadota bacterium]
MSELPRVVVVGGGFGGLAAVRALAHAEADVVLIDKRNHHLFQPLLYQVATAALSPGNIAAPIRRILARQANCQVMMAEVTGVDIEARTVTLADQEYAFDYLVLAAGARTNYFGHPEWALHAPGLKAVEEAIDVRARFLVAFEQAELESDSSARRAALTFAIVGAGPTGVEMAGAIAEISRHTLRRDFRHFDTNSARVILIDALDRVLSGFAPSLSARTGRDLERLGVELMLNARVVSVDERGLTVQTRECAERIDANNVIWAAGVKAVDLGIGSGVETDDLGRIEVSRDLSLPGYPHVFAVGDLARCEDPRSARVLPGVAQSAIQMGRFAGKTIGDEIAAGRKGDPAPPRRTFLYRDRGTMATIGRNKAVAEFGRLKLGGTPAFLAWAFVHILFLIDFRRRFSTLAEWTWMYFFYERGVRLITGVDRIPKPVRPPPDPRLAARPEPAHRREEPGSHPTDERKDT